MLTNFFWQSATTTCGISHWQSAMSTCCCASCSWLCYILLYSRSIYM